jgi:hypothetical protein
MKLTTLVIVLTGVALALATPAVADVRVGFSPGTGVNLAAEGTNGWRVIVEHFSDGSRSGFRVRQPSAAVKSPSRSSASWSGPTSGARASPW